MPRYQNLPMLHKHLLQCSCLCLAQRGGCGVTRNYAKSEEKSQTETNILHGVSAPLTLHVPPCVAKQQQVGSQNHYMKASAVIRSSRGQGCRQARTRQCPVIFANAYNILGPILGAFFYDKQASQGVNLINTSC